MNEPSAAPKSLKSPRVLVVTIEGLGTNLVGCYGGAIGPTKNWDSFASRGIVFDQFWADTLQTLDVLESMWSGTHFVQRQMDDREERDCVEILLHRGLLVTDSMLVIEGMSRDYFRDVLLVEPGEGDDEDLQDQEQTQLERLFEAALGRWATQMNECPVLWIHSRGLSGTWDAPYEYRQVMCDEGDPDPPSSSDPAELRITSETDPDEIFGMSCCAGGQAIAMDDAWGLIEETLLGLGIEDDCLQLLAGVTGYPMGEHGWVGYGGQSLYAETLHCALIVRPANQLPLGIRVPFMVQPNSVLTTIAQWFGMGETEKDASGISGIDLVSQSGAFPADQWPIANQLAYSSFEDQVHIAVPAWSCRWSQSAEKPELDDEALGEFPEGASSEATNSRGIFEREELFAMPDDRWQQNEISQRAVATLEQMREYRTRWLQSCLKRERDWETLPSELTHPTR